MTSRQQAIYFRLAINVPKQTKTKCEELSVLKTMQAITKFVCTAVLVKQLK